MSPQQPGQPPHAPPPFRPYRADPNADAKQNLVGFLEWVSDGIWRIHALSEANYRYSRATYDAVSRTQGAHPPQHPAPGFNGQDILFNLGRLAVENRAAFAKFFRKGFF